MRKNCGKTKENEETWILIYVASVAEKEKTSSSSIQSFCNSYFINRCLIGILAYCSLHVNFAFVENSLLFANTVTQKRYSDVENRKPLATKLEEWGKIVQPFFNAIPMSPWWQFVQQWNTDTHFWCWRFHLSLISRLLSPSQIPKFIVGWKKNFQVSYPIFTKQSTVNSSATGKLTI